MDVYEVIGICDGSYINRSGVAIYGYRFYFKNTKELVTKENANIKSEGFSVESCWMSKLNVDNMGFLPAIGDRVRLLYNRYGNVQSLQIAE